MKIIDPKDRIDELIKENSILVEDGAILTRKLEEAMKIINANVNLQKLVDLNAATDRGAKIDAVTRDYSRSRKT